MQSLFSCLFALLLYAGSRTLSCAMYARLLKGMMLFICKAYGNQFTVDELKDAESGLDAAGIVIEFNMIDMGIAEEMNKRMDKMMKNFQSGK